MDKQENEQPLDLSKSTKSDPDSTDGVDKGGAVCPGSSKQDIAAEKWSINVSPPPLPLPPAEVRLKPVRAFDDASTSAGVPLELEQGAADAETSSIHFCQKPEATTDIIEAEDGHSVPSKPLRKKQKCVFTISNEVKKLESSATGGMIRVFGRGDGRWAPPVRSSTPAPVPPSTSGRRIPPGNREIAEASPKMAWFPYMALVYLFLLGLCAVTLTAVAVKMVAVVCAVYTIPRTFAWELLLKFVGSSLEDCLDHSEPDVPLRMTVEDWGKCNFSFTFPWIPIGQAAILVLIVALLATVVARLIWSKVSASRVVNLLMLVCLVECIYFGYAIFQVHFSVGLCSSEGCGVDSIYLTESMRATLQDPDQVHPRWLESQNQFNCCELKESLNWINRNENYNAGDKRDGERCPTLDPEGDSKLWTDCCFDQQLEQLRSDRNEYIVFLIVGNFVTVFSIVCVLQLAIILQREECDFLRAFLACRCCVKRVEDRPPGGPIMTGASLQQEPEPEPLSDGATRTRRESFV